MTALRMKLKRSRMPSEPRTKVIVPDGVKKTDFVLQDEYGPKGS